MFERFLLDARPNALNDRNIIKSLFVEGDFVWCGTQKGTYNTGAAPSSCLRQRLPGEEYPCSSGAACPGAGAYLPRPGQTPGPVSYTHLDVYKRQIIACSVGSFKSPRQASFTAPYRPRCGPVPALFPAAAPLAQVAAPAPFRLRAGTCLLYTSRCV